MVDNLDFTEEEIQEQLAILGYTNIPQHRLLEFKQDLDDLIQSGELMSLASRSPSQITATSQPDPPAYIKEKVSLSGAFFQHPSKDNDAWAPSTHQNTADRQHAHRDLYAQHSVAQRFQLRPGAPSQLQVEPHVEETLNSTVSESHISSPDSTKHPFIKRKVLRKQNGQMFVCDESIYSEDSESTHFAIMYKMYNTVDDEDSSDDSNSVYSSFWSDQERKDDDSEQEEVEIEKRLDMKLHDSLENSIHRTAKEETPDGKKQESLTGDTLEEETQEYNDDDDDDEDMRCTSLDSPVPSLMTSGYGTYRPEDQDGGDDRDDHTINEFEQNSRADLSELRDEEEFDDVEVTHETGCNQDPSFTLEAANVCCGIDSPHKDRKRHHAESEEILWAEKYVVEKSIEKNSMKSVDSRADSDESQRIDIKFINSEVDWMTYEKKCEEWEGNLRLRKDAVSCLEERLSDLQLSPSAQEDEDLTDPPQSQSSDSEGSLSAFESYMRGMTRTLNHYDLRPKPKSFIRPIMSQQTIKKCDPVARYFQYKQLWDMFKCPGEADRRALRWEIKEQLAYKPPPPKPHRVFVPNTYIVPTEKKRSQVRWEVRNALANRITPYKFRYPF